MQGVPGIQKVYIFYIVTCEKGFGLLIYAWLSKAVTMVTGGYKYFIMASVVTPSR